MQDSWKQLKSDSTSWQSTLTSSHNLQNQWHVVSTLCHEMKNQLTRNVGFEGTQIGPVLEGTTSDLQGIYGVEIRIESVNQDNSHSWVRISLTDLTWSTKSTTTSSRRPLIRTRKYLRWRRKYLLLQADQRLKQNQEDLPLLAHLQELYQSVKEYGLKWNQELNSIKRSQWLKD